MMARDRIKSTASFRSDGRTRNWGPAGLGMVGSTRPCSMGTDLESSELAPRGDFGSPMTRRVLLDSRLAKDMVASGSPAKSSIVGESPVGFKLPSLDQVVCSGSKARAGTIVDP